MPNQPTKLIAYITLIIYLAPFFPKVDSASEHDARPKSLPINPKIDIITTTITYPIVPEAIASQNGILPARIAPSRKEGIHTQIPA